MSETATETKVIKLSDIRENPVSLRTVDRTSESYLGLVNSINNKGFIGSISVREKKTEDGESYYELVDGLHRFSAAKDAGLNEIKVDVQELDDSETIEAQIMMNVHKIETKPVEYANAIKLWLNLNPTKTLADAAQTFGKSVKWINDRLGLMKIKSEKLKSLINDGEIGLVNAYVLAKLPEEEQENYLEDAMIMEHGEFVPKITNRLKEINASKRKGRQPSEAEFTPVAYLRKLADLKTEFEKPENVMSLINSEKVDTIEGAVRLTLAFVLRLDPISIVEQEEKFEQRKREQEERKQKEKAAKAEAMAEKKQKEAKEARVALEEARNSGE